MKRSFSLILCLLGSFLLWVDIVQQRQRTVSLNLAGQSWVFTVADDAAERTKGLSGQTLEPGHGMVFDLGAEQTGQEFWMKDMLIDLDFVWLASNGLVVDTAENVPHPDCTDMQQCPPARRSSTHSARFVLELPAGTLATLPEPLQSVNVASLGP